MCNRVQHQKCVKVRFYDRSAQPTEPPLRALFMRVWCTFVLSSRSGEFGFVNRRSWVQSPPLAPAFAQRAKAVGPKLEERRRTQLPIPGTPVIAAAIHVSIQKVYFEIDWVWVAVFAVIAIAVVVLVLLKKK